MAKFSTVIIRQIPDDFAVYTGLHKHNRSKMPQTFEYLQPAQGLDGRFITGFDEDALVIKQITDPERRERKYNELKELREMLQIATGEDLSGTSKYWENYGVKLSADSNLTLNWENPRDIIAYHVLVSNRYTAPDRDTAANPEYRTCKYYCFTTERDDAEEVTTRKKRDRAKAALIKISEDKDMMVLIGQALEGDKYKIKMSENTLYRMLSDYIEDRKEPDNVSKFLKATDTNIEDLQFEITVKRAIKKRILRYDGGQYHKGRTPLGRNPVEVLANLKKPEFAAEYITLKEEMA